MVENAPDLSLDETSELTLRGAMRNLAGFKSEVPSSLTGSMPESFAQPTTEQDYDGEFSLLPLKLKALEAGFWDLELLKNFRPDADDFSRLRWEIAEFWEKYEQDYEDFSIEAEAFSSRIDELNSRIESFGIQSGMEWLPQSSVPDTFSIDYNRIMGYERIIFSIAMILPFVPSIWHKAKIPFRRIFRSSLQPGYSRIEWTCACGDRLIADIKENTQGSLAALARKLNGKLIAGPAFLRQASNDSQDVNEGRTPSQGSSEAPRMLNTPSTSIEPSNNTNIPVQLATDPTNRLLSERTVRNQQWLELCVMSGPLTHDLIELDIAGPHTDRSIFTKISASYNSIRRPLLFGIWRTRNSRGGLFVQFRKDQLAQSKKRATVAIMKRGSMPTKEEAKEYQYTFDPVPMDEPPMPPNIFHHYFSDPQHVEDVAAWITRFPKLDGKSLNFAGERLAKGWGVEILEDRNWTIFVVANTLLIFLSGVIAAIYARVTGDNQTAVAIGAWLSAMQTIVASAILYRWTDA